MVPLVYVQRVMLKLMRAAQSPQEFVVARFMLSRQRAQATWDHEQVRGLRVSPKAVAAAEGSEGTEGAEGAIAAAPEEADHDEDDELRGLAQFLGQPMVEHFVGAGDSPEPLADMMDHWGPYIKVENRLAAE